MMTITLRNKTDKELFHLVFTLISMSLPEDTQLTESEIEVLTYFCTLPDKFTYHRFSTHAKTKVIQRAEENGWKLSRTNINNKVYALERKGILWRDEDRVLYFSKTAKSIFELVKSSLDNKEDLRLNFVFKWES